MFDVIPAEKADIPALARLIASLFAMEPDFTPDLPRQAAGLALLMADSERSRVLMAVESGRIIGMLSVQLVISTAQGGWSGLMEDVVVAADRRTEGVGRALVTAAENWLEKKGATRMQVLADSENASALGFYERLGYQATRLVCRRKFLPQN